MPDSPVLNASEGSSDRHHKERSSSTQVHPQEGSGSLSPSTDDEDHFTKWYNSLPRTDDGGRVLPKDWAEHWQAPYQPRPYDYIPSSRSPSLSPPSSEARRSSTGTDSRQGAKTPAQESKKRRAEEQGPEASRHNAKRRDTKADRPTQRTYSQASPKEPVIELPRASGHVKAQTPQEVSPLDAIMGFASGVKSNILGKELLETLVGEYADRKAIVRTDIVRDFMKKSQETMYKNNVYQSDVECAKSYTEMLNSIGEALMKYNNFEKSSMTGRRFENYFSNDRASDDINVLPSIVALAKANRAVTAYRQSISEHNVPSAPLKSMQFVNDQGHPEHFYNEDGILKGARLVDLLKTNLSTIASSLAEREIDRATFLDKISKFESLTSGLEGKFAPGNVEYGYNNTSGAITVFKKSILQAFDHAVASEIRCMENYRDYVNSSSNLDQRSRERSRA